MGIYDSASYDNPGLRKKLAPTVWHNPSDAEWTILTDFLGGESVAGGKMKATGTALWQSPNTAATNESGFTGLPGGVGATFCCIGSVGGWWSTLSNGSTGAWTRRLVNNYDNLFRYDSGINNAWTVRCHRD